MKIAIGSDHGGFELKEFIKTFLIEEGYNVKDYGTFSEKSVDYPDIAQPLCKDIINNLFNRGILICGTGIGMSITANRFKGIRATLANDLYSAIMARKHNDSNILVMGGRVIGKEVAKEIVKAWLNEKYEGGRHQKRLDKIDSI